MNRDQLKMLEQRKTPAPDAVEVLEKASSDLREEIKKAVRKAARKARREQELTLE